MDQIVSGEEDLDVDIEENVLNHVLSGQLSFDGSENVAIKGDKRRERSSQSLDLSERKFDDFKFKKTSKVPSKPPRPPKGPSLNENDQKMIKEIAELAMRKRARTERMKTLTRLRATKSPCNSIFAMLVTVIFFILLIFQGFFTSNVSLMISDNSPPPTVSANSPMLSVRFYNEFSPRNKIDPIPTSSSFKYKRVSGANNEENTEEATR